MKYNVFTYLVGEGIANVFKNKKQAITSLASMCVIMVFFGICFLIVGNFNHFVKQVESEMGIQVVIENDATQEEIDKLREEILALDGVNTIKFVSKEDALTEMKDRFGEQSHILNVYDENNILPASYIITLTDLNLSSNLQTQIQELENVKKITSSNKTINTLIKIAKGIKIGSYIIIVALISVSIFIIANIIKLTVYARRKEISIMKYVGATNSFIRWPFIVEGMILGIISGIISLAIVAIIYILLAQNEGFTGFFSLLGLNLLQFSEMFNTIFIVYLVFGIGIGILGSTLSMRKYLNV